jgi:ATP/maltotriose-dependent transcriptional regulator MalT
MELRNVDQHFLALRLTVDEAGIFFNQIMNLSLTDQQVADLCQRTDGWIAGIQLAALSLIGREDVSNVQHFIDTFTHTNIEQELVEVGQGRAGLRRGEVGQAHKGQGQAHKGQGQAHKGQGQTHSGQGQAQSLRWVEMLSEREYSVLRLVSEGLSNQEIARSLVVTVSTVKTHLNNIYAKFQVHTRLQAVTRAYDLGLLSPWTGAEGCETGNVPLN